MSSTRSANAIPLSVATNFDPDLPGELARFNRGGARGRVVRAFGSLPADPVGGGRPAYRLPPITTEQLFEHATALAAEGIEFAYTLNAPDLFGSDMDPDWRTALDRFLAELAGGGIRRLIVANRWLLRHLRDHHRFALSLSLIGGVRDEEEAATARELGVDEIALQGQAVNRDLPRIARIRGATELTLSINANMACLVGCPWAEDHYRTLGFLSRRDRIEEGWVHTEPHILECSCHYLADPSRFVRSSFVPPSYMERYRSAGIDLFKFSDRTSDTRSLLRTVRAYGTGDGGPDLYEFVYKRGAKLKAPLWGLFDREFVAALPAPRFTIDARRFLAEDFIERQATAPPDEVERLARSLVTDHDPGYTGRYLSFLRAVKERVAGRALIPRGELPDLDSLRPMLDPWPTDGGTRNEDAR